MAENLKKSLGQHVLKNPGVVTALVDRGRIRPSDVVLEIGPGTGNLTMKLLEKSKCVVAVEKDKKIATDLLKRVGTKRNKMNLLIGDAIEVDFPPFDMCVSNTPYQISSPLTFKLLKYPFRAAILMFQREFAMRLCASPGDSYYCRLSVSVQIRANVQHVMKVSRKSFRPPPKVESSIVRIEPKRHQPNIDMDEFDGLVKICFSRKNKTLGSIFKLAAVRNLVNSNTRKSESSRDGNGIFEELPEKEIDFQEEEIDFAENRIGVAEKETRITEKEEGSIEKALKESKLEKERASKMSVEEFLFLLIKFKECGVSFSS